nr:hypothetical protein [Tanacetum cinerariifolium]
MVAGDAPPQPPPNTDKIIPFSIPNKVPIKLDLEKHNYNSWSSFSLIHLGSLVTTPDNAKVLWDLLKDLFHDNKDNRAINLNNELCSIKIGTMTVSEYCTKIQSMADCLKNLGCDVSDKNLVMYTVNGLESRFVTLVDIIRHRETLLSFETIRTMLMLKESSFKDDTRTSSTFDGSSSSPTALVTSTSSTPKVSLTQAMLDEYNALIRNGTWILVPMPAGVNMVRSMWLFKHKFHTSGTFSHYKARLVANGSSQQQAIDVDETFSPVVKPATIRTVLSLAVSRKWPIHQLDVKNAFLNAFSIWTAFCRLCHLGLVLSQSLRYFSFYLPTGKYACELLERANMVNCNPSRTPVDTDSKLGPKGVAVQDPTLYRSLAGGLQYLTFTRHDLSYICLYMPDPREPHFAALKHILRYVRGTVDFGLQLYASATTSLVGAEAEYRGVANVVAETVWLCNLLRELHSPLSTATLLYCDNTGHIRVLHVPSRYQYADIFTKGLPTALFEDFRSSLSVRLLPAQTAGAY